MTNFYIRKDNELSNYACDTNIIGDKRFLKFLSDGKYKEDESEPPIAPEWYPRCNSYYPYTEDVDALNRVNHLVASKRYLASFTNLETQPDISNPYDEDQAQNEFLRLKPATFLILGKPGIGEQKLGKLLAEHWKCVYIDPEILVTEEIESGSRAGQCIEFNLRCGRAVAIDVILRLLEKRVKSKSAQHRGFVVCGFPLIRNDMYQDDPVSSESAIFTAQEIFEEIVDPIFTASQIIRHVSQTSNLSKISLSKEATDGVPADVYEQQEEEEEERHENVKGMPTPNVTKDYSVDIGSTTSEICKITNIGTNYSEQLMFVFSLCHQPLIIIYIACPSTDVINKHENYRYDLNTHEVVNLLRDQSENIVYTIYAKKPGFDNEELPDDHIDAVREPSFGLSSSDVRYLTYLPSDFSGNVATQIEQYHFDALPTIEKRVLLHDPQYFIKVDGRTSPYRMFNIVKTKLRILPIPHVVVPELLLESFVPPVGEGDDIPDINTIFEDKTPSECFDNFRQRKIINRMFKWKLSKWGAFCPVAMADGIYIEGNPKFAMKFLDRLYFLSSENAVTKFTRNPRPYLLPPAPRHSCKILIIGPKASGKTAVANGLALLLNGKVLDPIYMQQEYFDRKKKQYLDKVRNEAINVGLIMLQEMRTEDYNRLEAEREKNVKKWLEDQSALLKKRIDLEDLMASESQMLVQSTAFPLPSMKRMQIDSQTMMCHQEEYELYRRTFLDVGLPCFSDIDLCQSLFDNSEELRNYLPETLKIPTAPFPPVSVFDDFVRENADLAVEKAMYDGFDMSVEDMMEMYSTAVKEAEAKAKEGGESHGGWIIDGVPPNTELVNSLLEECKPEDIFLLRDPEQEFLPRRFRIKGQNEFRNYREFFENIGKPEIASIAPSTMSTMSYKVRIARDTIDNLLDDERIAGYEDVMEEGDEQEEGEFVDADYFAIHSTRLALKEYKHDLEEFEFKCLDLMSYFEENNVPFVDVNLANKSLTQLLTDIIKHINSRFCIRAHPFTPEERIQEVEDFGEPEIVGEDMGEEEEPKSGDAIDSFSENRRLGNTNYYCPVTFHDRWVLWRGKEEYAAKYDDKLYFMHSEETLESFIKNPWDYLKNKAPKSFPPPRICVVGVAGSGKTTLAKHLSKTLGLYYVSYENLLKKLFHSRYRLELSDLNTLIRRYEGSTESTSIEEYLLSGQPLPDEFMDKMKLQDLWYTEPIKSGGFVLDDYPKRPCDVDYMQEYVLIPDIIIELSGTNDVVNTRRIQQSIAQWTETMQNAQEERDKINRQIADEWEEQRNVKMAQLLDIKRQDRFQAKMKEKLQDDSHKDEIDEKDESPNRSQISYDSVAEEADYEEALKEVAFELPEPLFDDDWETLEDATQRIISQTENAYIADIEFYGALKESCETELIDWGIIDADMSLEKVHNEAMRNVDKIKFRNKSFFERCYNVTVELAEKLLETGYYFLSRFGRVCPVQLYENINPLLMFYPLEQRFDLYPVLHRSYVYFLAGKENKDKFFADPLKYTSQLNTKFPLVPFKVAVIGPPKCGKTALSERFKKDMGLKYVSIGQATRYVLRFLPYSTLAKRMESVLRMGWELTSEMTMKCVEAMAFDGRSVTQGIVFDGFPNSKDDVEHLEELGLVPHLIIDINASTDDIHMCLETDPGKRGISTFSKKFIDHRYSEWSQYSNKFRMWIDREYQILGELSIDKCKWGVWNSAYELAASVLFEIKHYYKNSNYYMGLRLANMQVSPKEFLERRSSFKHYCPACLHYKNLLVSSGEPPDRTGVVQFNNNFYWLCADHIEEFVGNPEAYLSPYNKNMLPKELPIEVKLTEKPANCYENGTCIVCYHDSQSERILNEGNLDLACSYDGRIYLFDTKECMKKFMSNAWVYSKKDAIFKVPIPVASLKSEDLPVLGLLEQYVAQDVVKAITNTGITRPVLAGLTIAQSAALNMGLHLKVNNSNTPKENLQLFKEAYQMFKERRLSFINNLAKMKQTVNPRLHYEEPLQKLHLPTFGNEKLPVVKFTSACTTDRNENSVDGRADIL